MQSVSETSMKGWYTIFYYKRLWSGISNGFLSLIFGYHPSNFLCWNFWTKFYY